MASTYINCGSPKSPVELTLQLNASKKGNIIISSSKGKKFLSISAHRSDSSNIEFKAKRESTVYSISFDKRVLKKASDFFTTDLYIETATRIHREQLNCYSKIFH